MPGTDASHVLQDITLQVNEGEIVCLIGRNGAGKTTTLQSMMGLIDRRDGSVHVQGRGDVEARRRMPASRAGSPTCPEERRIVPGLSVRENLRLGLVASQAKHEESAAIAEIAEIFPRLNERLDQEAMTLSGGEQQMLAIARAMIARAEAGPARRALGRHHAGAGRGDVRAVPPHEERGHDDCCWSSRTSNGRSISPIAPMCSTRATSCIRPPPGAARRQGDPGALLLGVSRRCRRAASQSSERYGSTRRRWRR